MNKTSVSEPKSFDDVLAIVCQSAPLVNIKKYLDQSSLSSDLKSVIYNVAQYTVTIGGKIIAIGRRILEIAIGLVKKYPNTALGAVVGAVIGTLVIGPLGSITIAGVAPFAGLAALLSKILVLLGVGKGFIDDIRNKAARSEFERVAMEFDILGKGLKNV